MTFSSGIIAPNYVVGETSLNVDELPNKTEVLAAHTMPDMKELWGWEYCRKSEKSLAELAYETAIKTIQQSGISTCEIDAVLFCSSDNLNYYQQNKCLGEIACKLDLGHAFLSWIGGSGCASLFSAIKLANSMIISENCTNALVIAVDKINNEAQRFQRYGVVSDGACSLIVKETDNPDFRITGVDVLSCPHSVLHGDEDYQKKFQLIYQSFENLGKKTAFDFNQVEVLFGSNIYKPMLDIELSVIPVEGITAYTDNIARYGHCFSSDTVINLVDYYHNVSADDDKNIYSLLASTAHGHFGVLLLEKVSNSDFG